MLYNGQKIETPQYVIDLARKQRRNMTDTEKMLWECLRKKQLAGYRFRNQHPVYRYILDFYCHECMLAVEIDGGVHEGRKDYDAYRDQFLESIGIRTVRYSADEVINNIEPVLLKIQAALSPPARAARKAACQQVTGRNKLLTQRGSSPPAPGGGGIQKVISPPLGDLGGVNLREQ